MISEEDQKILPEDENTPEKRADKIWFFFGKKENGKINLCTILAYQENFKLHHYYNFSIRFLDLMQQSVLIQSLDGLYRHSNEVHRKFRQQTTNIFEVKPHIL